MHLSTSPDLANPWNPSMAEPTAEPTPVDDAAELEAAVGQAVEAQDGQSVTIPQFDVMSVNKPLCGFNLLSIVGRGPKHFSVDEMTVVADDVGAIVGHMPPCRREVARRIIDRRPAINEKTISGGPARLASAAGMPGTGGSPFPAQQYGSRI
jgi:hypothetical protein